LEDESPELRVPVEGVSPFLKADQIKNYDSKMKKFVKQKKKKQSKKIVLLDKPSPNRRASINFTAAPDKDISLGPQSSRR
jgi:hypothetical protein